MLNPYKGTDGFWVKANFHTHTQLPDLYGGKGVPAQDVNYRGQAYREFREMLARAKDFCTAVIRPQPKFLGEEIPISGNGDLTNDK